MGQGGGRCEALYGDVREVTRGEKAGMMRSVQSGAGATGNAPRFTSSDTTVAGADAALRLLEAATPLGQPRAPLAINAPPFPPLPPPAAPTPVMGAGDAAPQTPFRGVVESFARRLRIRRKQTPPPLTPPLGRGQGPALAASSDGIPVADPSPSAATLPSQEEQGQEEPRRSAIPSL